MSISGTIPSAWTSQPRLQVSICCSAFLEATEGGSDNEGYGALISAWQGAWKIGSDRPPLLFCPWCGGRPEAPPAEEPPRGWYA